MNFLIDGLKGWLIQRISAIFMVFFFLYFFSYFLLTPPNNVIEWQNWLGSVTNQIFISCFFGLLILHAWVGIRDVIFDYINPGHLQNILLFALGVFLMACTLWGARVIL